MASDDVEAIKVSLARIETKLDHSLSDVSDHEDRLRKLERIVWIATGLAAASGGAIGAAATSIIQGG
jgi:hypothetical protein